MHGMELRGRERRASRRSAPPPVLSPPAGSTLPGTPQPSFPLPTGTGSSQRPFPRPQRSPLSQIPSRGQRSRPAASPPAPQFPSPFGLLLHRRSAVRPAPGRFFAPARRLVPVALEPRLYGLRSPNGMLASPRDQSVLPLPRRSVRLPTTPDLHSLPVAVSIASIGYGSLFLVRYVPGGWLFLKPLGTSLTMPPMAGMVKQI